MLSVLPLLRGLHLLCLVSLLGTLTARLVVAPGFAASRVELDRLARASLLLAVLTLLPWLLLQAAAFAEATGFGGAVATLPVVLWHTRFGHILALRLILLAATWPLIGRGRTACVAASALAAVALMLQADLGHAGAAAGREGAALLASESLHLIAAGAWLGGLLPLLIMTLRLPNPLAAVAARRFTAVGLPAVLILMATALVQGDALVGGLPGLFGTDYGHVALVKLALFIGLLALALLNRFVLTARFEQSRVGRASLVAAISIEAVAGVAVVMAASVLASLEPGLHAEPVWLFPLRPSTVALEDPDLRWEVMIALAGAAAGALLTVVGLTRRRRRLPLLAIGLVAFAAAMPHLRPLLVEAFPTSYVHSPTGFSAASIMRGAAVFAANCTACHGSEGRGDGPLAKSLVVPPADLTQPHLWEHSDGELFWWLTHGIDNPEGGLSMTGFAAALSEDDRWAAIDFIRANNAGIAVHRNGSWPQPVLAPEVPLICADADQTDMRDLRGRLVQVLAAVAPFPAASQPIEQKLGFALATVQLSPPFDAGKIRGDCLAATPDAWPAFAIVTGVASSSLAGSVIVIDPSGWLRAVIHTDGQTDPASLVLPMLTETARHPIINPPGEAHAHH